VPRKYVIGNRSDGLSDVLQDEDVTFDGPSGTKDLWFNTTTPADLATTADPTVGAKFVHEAPDGGAVFRIASWAPGTLNDKTPEEMQAVHAQIGTAHIPSVEYLKSAKHPSMHRTDTLNYIAVLSGKMWALTEGRDVLLGPGDVIVLKGCIHGWRIEGTEPCVIAATFIDGDWSSGLAPIDQ
jgi:quercetin dioxygenase-like cupin family protein